LEEIQRRGRWKSFAAVRRYEKGGRLQQLLRQLPKKVLSDALDAASNIEQIFLRLRKELLGLLALLSSWKSSQVVATWQRQLRVKQDGVS
jgi:hypothetical protein